MEEIKTENRQQSEPHTEPPQEAKPQEVKPPKELTQEQRQLRKKLIVYPLMGLLFCGSMWLIFAPSSDQSKEQQLGFNTNIPAPIENQLVEDKQKAYQMDMLSRQREERGELGAILGSSNVGTLADVYIDEQTVEQTPQSDEVGSSRPRSTIYASANAYQDINRTLGSFYEPTPNTSQTDALIDRIDALNARIIELEDTPKVAKSNFDEQVALIEKSYQIAAKYMPNGNGQETSEKSQSKGAERVSSDKATLLEVNRSEQSVVSALRQPMSDSAFMAEVTTPRNYQFNTPIGVEQQIEKNTIKACIHTNQTITDGEAVRMRLLEEIVAGGVQIPKNALITGVGKIQGDRLSVLVSSLEYQGVIIPVELTVLDDDGQRGIYIPNSVEVSATKELIANMGGNLGTTINLNQQSAGQQLLTDLGRGAIQGASQYIAKKTRTERVHLKSGYNITSYQGKIN